MGNEGIPCYRGNKPAAMTHISWYDILNLLQLFSTVPHGWLHTGYFRAGSNYFFVRTSGLFPFISTALSPVPHD
jgi:hypothetical protein